MIPTSKIPESDPLILLLGRQTVLLCVFVRDCCRLVFNSFEGTGADVRHVF